MPEARTALVTGASAGIGEAICRVLAERQFNLVVVARRGPRLQALQDDLTRRFGITVTPIVADLADPQAPAQLVQQLKDRAIDVDWLVNNAGYGVPGGYLSSDWSVHRQFLQVMIGAVAELTWCLLPAMKRRAHGRVVNIASLAGLVPPGGGHTLYAAVKSWMIMFSQALDSELRSSGVRVTAVCPGFTYSEFHDVSGMREQMGKMPRALWMTAEKVAEQAVQAAERGDTIYVNGTVNRVAAGLARWLPRRLFLRLTRRQNRNSRNND